MKLTDDFKQALHDSMGGVIQDKVPGIVHDVIQGVVPGIVRSTMHDAIREEVPGVVHDILPDLVRDSVRDELQDVREDIRMLKDVQGAQGMQLRRIESTMSGLSATVRTHGGELHRLNVLLEDLYDRFSAARELRWD